MLFLLSCTDPSSNSSFSFGDQSETKDFDTTGSWTIGEVESCSRNAQEPSWTDESSALWGERRTDQNGQPAACLALFPEDNTWMVAGTTKEFNLSWSLLTKPVTSDALPVPGLARTHAPRHSCKNLSPVSYRTLSIPNRMHL